MNNKFKCLLLIDFKALHVTTTKDNVNSLLMHSELKFHLCDFRILFINIFNLQNYDLIIIHWSVDIHKEYNQKILKRIKQFNGLKVIFRQDEHKNVRKIEEFVLDLRFDIFFSCIPKNVIKKIYSKKFLKHLKVKSILTSYIPEYFKFLKKQPYEKRPYLIGYRGRNLPFYLGSMGQDKKLIGDLFKNKISNNYNINISSDENKRIYGSYWFKFLSKCKCVLGTESGASIVDFNGKIEDKIKIFLNKNPKSSFKNCYDKFLKQIDGKISTNTISPRIFEAIANGCLLVLFEGKYNNILKKWVHYIPVKKDGSNLNFVLKKILNTSNSKKIINRTFKEIVLSEKYSYKKFVTDFENEIFNSFKKKPINKSIFKNVALYSTYKIILIVYKIINRCINKNLKIFLKFKFFKLK